MERKLSIALVLGLFLTTGTTLFAQEKKAEKMVIGVYPLKTVTEEKDDQEEATLIAGLIVQVLQRTDNFEVISGSGEDLAQEVRDKSKKADYAGGKTAKQFSAAGALQAMGGTLNSFESSVAESKSTGKGVIGAINAVSSGNTTVTVNYTLDLVDVATGKSKASYTFTASGVGMGGGQGAFTTARDVAHKRVKKQISNWVVSLLDFDFKIHEVLTRNKDGIPKTVLIMGGENMDLQKLEKLDVKQVTIIEGKERSEQVCVLQIDEVQGDFSICKVLGTKAAEALNTKLEAKVPLKIWFQPEKD